MCGPLGSDADVVGRVAGKTLAGGQAELEWEE